MSDLVYQNYNNRCQGWTNPSNLVFGPQIGSLSSYYSPSGSTTLVTITGSYFFSYSSVSFGTTNPSIYFINSNNIQFYVPTTLSPGTYSVQVFNGSSGSNIVNYTIDNSYSYWVLNSNNTISNNNTNGLTINGLVGQTLPITTNTSFGSLALNNSVTGTNNTVFGNNAAPLLTSGSRNTIVGNNVGSELTSGDDNTFIGQQSGRNSTDGTQNTFVGQQSGLNNESGNANVYIGEHAGYSATGSNNTCIGQNAGDTITTGNNNTCIGQNANPSDGTLSNQIILGTVNESVIIPSKITYGSNYKYALDVGGDVSISGICNTYVLSRGAPVIVTQSSYTVPDNISWIICNGVTTITLPSGPSYNGRELMLKNISTSTVNSASSNISYDGKNTTSNILPGVASFTPYPWATLVYNYDKNIWISMQSNF